MHALSINFCCYTVPENITIFILSTSTTVIIAVSLCAVVMQRSRHRTCDQCYVTTRGKLFTHVDVILDPWLAYRKTSEKVTKCLASYSAFTKDLVLYVYRRVVSGPKLSWSLNPWVVRMLYRARSSPRRTCLNTDGSTLGRGHGFVTATTAK